MCLNRLKVASALGRIDLKAEVEVEAAKAAEEVATARTAEVEAKAAKAATAEEEAVAAKTAVPVPLPDDTLRIIWQFKWRAERAEAAQRIQCAVRQRQHRVLSHGRLRGEQLQQLRMRWDEVTMISPALLRHMVRRFVMAPDGSRFLMARRLPY